MKKMIKYILFALTAILLLSAYAFIYSPKSLQNSEPKQETRELDIEQKINNKQKYITIQKYMNEDISFDENKTSNFIEKISNSMALKQYELKHQDLTFGKYGTIQGIILTFEYKGE